MPGAPLTGQDYLLQIAPDVSGAPGTYIDIGRTRAKSLKRSVSLIDVSSDYDPDFEANIPGMRSWSIDGEAINIYDDAGQVALETAHASKVPYWFKIKPVGTALTGQRTHTGQGWVTDLSESTQTNQAVTTTFSVRGNGALTTAVAV